MILKRLKLHNYRQHADVDVPLDGTLIAVVGPNGSGKTNLLGAIQFAFTGEQSGFKKADLLRWGESEGEVRVEFEHNGTTGEIVRSLHNSGAVFKFGSEVFRSATAVTEALKLHLELDKDLLKQAVFVRQAEIDAILFTDPRIRELSFQRLMGIGDANKIHKVIGDMLGELSEPPNYDEQIAEGKKRWTELHERMTGLQTAIEGMRAQRGLMPSAETIRGQIAGHQTKIVSLGRVIDARRNLAEHQNVLENARLRVAAIPAVTGDLPTMDREIAILQQRSTQALLYQEAKTAWMQAGQAVLGLGTQKYAPEELQAARAEYDQLTAEINQLLGKHKFHKDLFGLVTQATGTECPVCGSAIKDSEWLRNRLRTIMDNLEVRGTELRTIQMTSQSRVASMQAEIDQFQRQYTTLTARYTQADQRLKSLPENTDDVHALRKAVEDLTQQRRTLIDNATLLTSATSALQTQLQHAAALQQRLDAARTAALSLGLDAGVVDSDNTETVNRLKTEITAWEQQLQLIQQVDTELARLEGTTAELVNSMGALDKTVATLEYKRSNQKSYKDTVATIGRVRDWFHYGNGPHMLSTSVLGVLNQDVNRFLSQFTAPFTVEPSNDALGFRCYFTDGRALPADGAPDASMLSGGQKIQLAVAFRFATYCMFASKLGLLSLDEPTAYLDDQNVGRFGDLLQQIKQVAKHMNLQVLMATHERSVMPFMDTVIDLADPNTVHSDKV